MLYYIGTLSFCSMNSQPFGHPKDYLNIIHCPVYHSIRPSAHSSMSLLFSIYPASKSDRRRMITAILHMNLVIFSNRLSKFNRQLLLFMRNYDAFIIRLLLNPVETFFLFQVISRVGDLVGIKYFPAEPKKQQEEEKMLKLE